MPKQFEVDTSFINDLTCLIKKQDTNAISKKLQKVHTADIADIIENLTEIDAQFLFEIIENTKSAEIFIELEDEIRESILNEFSAKKIAKKIINNLESDNAADVISELSKEKKEKVLSYISDKNQRSDITDLLKFEENSAGSLMAVELVKVNQSWTTEKCLKEVRVQAEKIKNIHSIYVVDDNNKLCGLLSLKKLLVSGKSNLIKSIINSNFISVDSKKDNEFVANIMNKYNLVVIPVVNEKNELLGRITIDDILNFVKEAAEKDYQIASGISEDVEANDNIWDITRARLPWLIIGLIGGLLGAKVIGFFEIEKNIELAFFIPLIAAMAGNVGIQSAAIVVQGLANNTLKTEETFVRLLKEFGVALFNGIICSILIFFLTYILNFNIELSFTVSISLLAVIIFAAIFGTSTPLLLEKYKIDPALATGPFITTVNDIIGLIIYFTIGQVLL
tara:strand:+ start:6594 stop:7943 length:1350 start_codon:yes stop_codon:yes gene_type:complete